MSVNGDDVKFFAFEDGGKSGRLFGHVYFADGVYLDMQERVVIEDDSVHRVDYGYFLVIDGIEYWGYERDLTHDPPVHRHTYGHEDRIEVEPVSFKRVCELAWEEVGRR